MNLPYWFLKNRTPGFFTANTGGDIVTLDSEPKFQRNKHAGNSLIIIAMCCMKRVNKNSKIDQCPGMFPRAGKTNWVWAHDL